MKSKENITPVNLVHQIQDDYLSYSMAVLVGRAVPDLYDGLKPVQRRILQTMLEEGITPDKKYVKSARITGLTMGYYHPHGDSYGALVNMATSWNNNVPWVDGWGNFGSTVDNPASARYTEAKLRQSAIDILLKNSETWETTFNYDNSRKEAVRFNTAVPSVLLNGDSGIAVGFATRIAHHNLRDVIKATQAACKFAVSGKDAKTNIEAARKLLIPDFPTGCDIVNDEQLELYKTTGSGSIRVRAKHETGIQKRDGRAKDRPYVTFTNLPPGVNPEKVGSQIAEAVEKGRIEGVAEVLDESDMSGDRITVIAKPGIDPELFAKTLYAITDLDSKFSAKTLVIDKGKPVELSPVEICQKWFAWRGERVLVQGQLDYDKTEARLEIVMGFIKAIGKIDAVIKTIKASENRKAAQEALVNRPHKFTPDQARAILDMRLHQLTGLDVADLEQEKEELEERLTDLHDLINEPSSRAVRIYKQLDEIGKRHGNARRSALIEPPDTLVLSSGIKKTAPVASKPRFIKVDQKRGVLEQAKGPRGAMVLEKTDKLVVLTEDGTWRKLPSNYKGAVSTGYSPVTLAKKEAEVSERQYLCVFKLEDQLKAMVIKGEDLVKATSKAKRWLPEGAEPVYFGEGTYNVPYLSKRRKALTLDLKTKVGKPGSRGVKIAQLTDVGI